MTMKKEILKNNKTQPNLKDYAVACKKFRWEDAENELGLSTKDGINIATSAIDTHAASWRKNKVALYWEGADGGCKEYSFGDLQRESNRVGNMLRSLGVRKGDRVFVFLPRIPELFISIIGIAKIGAVAGPMFSAFGPEAIRDRLKDSGAKVLIVDDLLATGGTMAAACELMEKLNATIEALAFLIELTELAGREKLTKYNIYTVISY